MRAFMPTMFLLTVFLVAGCAREPDLTCPMNVVEQYIDALQVDQDIDKAASLVIESYRDIFLFEEIIENIADIEPYPENPEYSLSVEGDQATVEFKNWDSSVGSFFLERKDGVWWISTAPLEF